MSFTDDDLNRLKRLCIQYKDDSYEVPVKNKRDLQALLARLEAAEECFCHDETCGVCQGEGGSKDRWRKACGR